jgi:hypothetical protein
MIITCIDSSNIYSKTSLTIGNRYLVVERDYIGSQGLNMRINQFRVIDDFGNDEYWYDSSRFEPVEITRNNILEDLGI